DLDHREFRFNGHSAGLTEIEMKLLLELSSEPDRIFTKDELLDAVWGTGHTGGEYALTATVKRLRKKIECNFRKPELVRNVHGVGYKLVAPYAVRKAGGGS